MSFKLSDWLKNPQGVAAWMVTDLGYLNSVLPAGFSDEDTISFNESIGNPAQRWVEYESFIPGLRKQEKVIAESESLITKQIYMNTPLGEKGWVLPLKKGAGEVKLGDSVSAPVKNEEDFALFDWYLELVRNNDWSACKAEWKRLAATFGDRADLAIFLCPPSELLYWTRREELFYLCYDFPELYQRAMDRILDAYEFILPMAAECGVKIAGYGAPGGTEFTSPSFWEEFIVPSSQRLEKICRKAGLYTLFHCCGKITTLVEKGYISQIGPTLYETAAPPPVGDVTDLARIRRMIDPKTILHGNLDLSLLKDGTLGEVLKAAEAVVAGTGTPHLIGASDACLWPGTPVETLRGLCRAYNP